MEIALACQLCLRGEVSLFYHFNCAKTWYYLPGGKEAMRRAGACLEENKYSKEASDSSEVIAQFPVKLIHG